MRPQIVQCVINVLLFGLSTRYNQANGFGFNFFSPASPPSIPLQVAANSPFPFPFPSAPCGAAPFCPPPTIILAPSFPSGAPFFPPPFPPAYPPPYPYPYPPPAYPYPYPQPPSSPKQTLFSSILDSILSKKGKSMPQPPPAPPPPTPMQYPPQQSRIQVHSVKDSGQSHKKQNQHQNHWREEKPKWN